MEVEDLVAAQTRYNHSGDPADLDSLLAIAYAAGATLPYDKLIGVQCNRPSETSLVVGSVAITGAIAHADGPAAILMHRFDTSTGVNRILLAAVTAATVLRDPRALMAALDVADPRMVAGLTGSEHALAVAASQGAEQVALAIVSRIAQCKPGSVSGVLANLLCRIEPFSKDLGKASTAFKHVWLHLAWAYPVDSLQALLAVDELFYGMTPQDLWRDLVLAGQYPVEVLDECARSCDREGTGMGMWLLDLAREHTLLGGALDALPSETSMRMP